MKFYLNDGRHRWLPARMYGASKIRADVTIDYSENDSMPVGVMTIGIASDDLGRLIKIADKVYRKDRERPPDRSLRFN